MKSEDRSLKTFLSNDDADETIANHHTDVRFHYIQLKSFQFPSILFVYFVTELNNCLTFAQFKLKYMKISENIKYVWLHSHPPTLFFSSCSRNLFSDLNTLMFHRMGQSIKLSIMSNWMLTVEHLVDLTLHCRVPRAALDIILHVNLDWEIISIRTLLGYYHPTTHCLIIQQQIRQWQYMRSGQVVLIMA